MKKFSQLENIYILSGRLNTSVVIQSFYETKAAEWKGKNFKEQYFPLLWCEYKCDWLSHDTFLFLSFYSLLHLRPEVRAIMHIHVE